MPLPALIETETDIPEEAKAFYKEQEVDLAGETKKAFVLDVAPAGGLVLENVANLKSALQKQKEMAKSAKEALDVLKPFEELGLKPSEIRKKLEEATKLAEMDPEKEADKLAGAKAEQLMRDRELKWKADMDNIKTEKDEMVSNLSSQLDHALAETALSYAVSKHGGNQFAMDHLRSIAKIEEVEGKRRLLLKNEDGSPRFTTKQGSAEFMDVDEAMGIMKDDPQYAPLFNGRNGVSGGGQSSSETFDPSGGGKSVNELASEIGVDVIR